MRFLTPVAAAIWSAEREYLVDDDVLAHAKRRVAEGPAGADAAAEPWTSDEESEEESEEEAGTGAGAGGRKGFWKEDEAGGEESMLLAVPKVEVFRIPQQATGHRSQEWGGKAVWSGKLAVVQHGDACTVRLLDRATEKEFAQAPITDGAVARTEDSGRRFSLRCVNRTTGQKAFVGLAFNEESADALHFAVALRDFAAFNKKKRQRRVAAALAAAEQAAAAAPPGVARVVGGVEVTLASAVLLAEKTAAYFFRRPNDVAALPALRDLCEATVMDPEASFDDRRAATAAMPLLLAVEEEAEVALLAKEGAWAGLPPSEFDDEVAEDPVVGGEVAAAAAAAAGASEGGGGGGADDDEDDEDDRPRFGGFGGGGEDDDGGRLDIHAEQEFIANDTVQKEVKLMRVRGQRHGASLPRGHEEVKSSMHANIDGFKAELKTGVDVIKFNQKNAQTGSRTISLSGPDMNTLVVVNKKKMMGFSKEQYDMTTIVAVRKGELPDPDAKGKFDLGTETLRMHADKSEAARAMRDAGTCFSLVFPERSIDLAAQSKAQRDFLFGGFELMAGKGKDFGKIIKVALHTKSLEGLGLGNDWSSGQLLVVSVGAGTEAEAVGLMAGDKVTKVNNDAGYATMDAHMAQKQLKVAPRPAVFMVERVDNLDHTEELHRTVQREKVRPVFAPFAVGPSLHCRLRPPHPPPPPFALGTTRFLEICLPRRSWRLSRPPSSTLGSSRWRT